MLGLTIPAEAMPWVSLAILAVMFTLFMLETFPVEVTAIGAAAAMMLIGILPLKEAWDVSVGIANGVMIDHRDS